MTGSNSDPEAAAIDRKQSAVGMDPHLSHDEGKTCAAINDETARVVDHEAERKLCFKFDIRLLPVLAIMCTYPNAFSSSTEQNLTVSLSRPLQCPGQGQHW